MTDSTPTPVFESETTKNVAQSGPKWPTENREIDENPSNSGLSNKQWAVLMLMLEGRLTDTEIATEMGVGRRTLYRWRTEDLAFSSELLRQRRLQFRRQMDRARSLTDKGLATLDQQVQNPYEPTSHRAARTLLSLTKVGLAVYEESAPKPEEPEA